VYGLAYLSILGGTRIVVLRGGSFVFSATGLIWAALIESAVLLVAAFGAAAGERETIRLRLRLQPPRTTLAGTSAVVVGLLGLSLACGSAYELLPHDGTVLDVLAGAMRSLRSTSGCGLISALVALGFAPAFAEEVFFRGWMQRELAASWGRGPAIVVTAAAFGLLHVEGVQGSIAFLAGLFLGWAADRSHSILPSIAAHATNNVLWLLWSFSATPQPGSSVARTVCLSLGSVAFCTAVAWLRHAPLAPPAIARELTVREARQGEAR
jgi:membrane protease YdiL (CAAX protease family)